MWVRRFDSEYPCNSDPEHRLTTFMSGCSRTEAFILSNSSDDNLESMCLMVACMAESLKASSPPNGACGAGAWASGFAMPFGSTFACGRAHGSTGCCSFAAFVLTPFSFLFWMH